MNYRLYLCISIFYEIGNATIKYTSQTSNLNRAWCIRMPATLLDFIIQQTSFSAELLMKLWDFLKADDCQLKDKILSSTEK